MEVTPHDYVDWREQQTSFEDLAAFTMGTANLSTDDGRPERYDAGFMTANSFALLRQEPFLGRAFQPGDDAPGAARVAVLGYDVWRNRFRGEADAIGRTVRINGEPTTIVGVMPEGFQFPVRQDLWLPGTWTCPGSSGATATRWRCSAASRRARRSTRPAPR